MIGYAQIKEIQEIKDILKTIRQENMNNKAIQSVFVKTKQASQILGVSTREVRYLYKKGRLRNVSTNKHLLFVRKEVEEVKDL